MFWILCAWGSPTGQIMFIYVLMCQRFSQQAIYSSLLVLKIVYLSSDVPEVLTTGHIIRSIWIIVCRCSAKWPHWLVIQENEATANIRICEAHLNIDKQAVPLRKGESYVLIYNLIKDNLYSVYFGGNTLFELPRKQWRALQMVSKNMLFPKSDRWTPSSSLNISGARRFNSG